MQQNELRARGIDMTELDARPGCLRKTSPFFLVWPWHTRHTARIDLRRRGAIVGHGWHFAGAWLTIAPQRTNDEAPPRSTGPLHSSPTKPAAWFPLRLEREHEVFWAGRNCGEQPCWKKIELKAKALTVFVMPGCAKETPFSGPKVDQPSSPLAISGFSLSFTRRRC